MYRSKFSWPQYYLGVSCQLHDPTDLNLGKELPGTQSGRCIEEKIPDPTGTRTTTTVSSSSQALTITIGLSQFTTVTRRKKDNNVFCVLMLSIYKIATDINV
jgi:hypothetical protein